MKKIKDIIESHKFFVEESPKFADDRSIFAYYMYYPIAYCKFMWYTLKNS